MMMRRRPLRTFLLILSLIRADHYLMPATESFSLIPQNCRRAHRHEPNSHSTPVVVAEGHNAPQYMGSDIGIDLQQNQNILELNINDDDEGGGILASLFGSAAARDHFFDNIFNKRVAYYHRSPVGWQQPQKLAPPITGIDLPTLYETNEYTSLRIRGSFDRLDKTQMSYQRLTEYIADGGSVVVPVTPDDYLHTIKLQLERAFGVEEETGTTVNIYHSGPSAVALNLHCDAWPVFVLQLQGHKEWIVQDDASGLETPLKSITKWKNITMTEGDLLYIPKGVYHAATTAEGYDTTTHATIGLNKPT